MSRLLLVVFVVLASQAGLADATTGVVIGKKYIVPSPNDLPNMINYVNMVNQCSLGPSRTECNTAMTQFLSDLYLMVPDTRAYIKDLKDKVATDKDVVTVKKNSLQALQTTVDTWSGNLIRATDSLNADETDYYKKLGDLQASIAAMRDETTSPVLTAATTQRKAILDQLAALSTAASTFLSTQRTNVKTTADYVYQLFKNDQAIIAADAASSLKQSTDQSATLLASIDELRQNFQRNVTAESANMDTMELKVAEAKSDSDNRIATTKTTIAANILAALDAAMATSRAAYTTKLAAVTAAIDKQRTDAYAVFDAALAKAVKADSDATAVIESNLTATQTAVDALKSLVDVKILSASQAQNDTLKTLDSTQATSMSRINTQVGSLNTTLTEYATKAAATTKTVFARHQTFMGNFANLASDAAGQLGGQMASDAHTDGNSLSDLNGYIGGLSGSAQAQSENAAVSMSESITGTRESAAMTTMRQITALADSVDSITALVSLLKAKLGYSSDKNDVQMRSVSDLLRFGTDGLTKTLQAVSGQVAASATAVSKDVGKKLQQVSAASRDGKRALDAQLSTIRANLDGQINEVTMRRTDATALAEKVAYDGSKNAQKIAGSNAELGTKVTALRNDLSGKWNVVTGTNADLAAAVNTALSALWTQASTMADTQKASGLAYVAGKQDQFSSAVNASQATALSAQTAAINAAAAVVAAIGTDLNSSQSNTLQVVNDTILAVNATVNSAKLLPAVLVSIATDAEVSAAQMRDAAISRLRAKVDRVRSELMGNITARTSSYSNTSDSQLAPVNASLVALEQSIKSQLALRDALFPDGVDLFNLSADAFRNRLTVATASVRNASSSLSNRYQGLESAMNNIYATLVGSMNAVSNKASVLESSFAPSVDQAVLDAQQRIDSNKTAFNAYADALIGEFANNVSVETTAASAVVNSDIAAFDAVMTNASAITQKVLDDAVLRAQTDETKQAALADSMDEIVQSLIAIAGTNGGLLETLKNQFISLQSSTGGIGPALNASLANAIASVSQASVAAQTALQAKIAQQNRAAIGNMASLGDRLAFAIDTLKSGSQSDLASLQDADADALALAKAVGALGDDAKNQIREVLEKVLSGEQTMDEVLSARSSANVAQMTTVEDVIGAFVDAVQSYISKTSASYDSEEQKLLALESAVPAVIQLFETARGSAMSNTKVIAGQADGLATSYLNMVGSLTSDAEAAMSEAQARLTTAHTALPDEVKRIEKLIKDAVETVEDSQDQVAQQILDAAITTRKNVSTKIRAFRTAKNKPTYALDVEEVELPTVAPRLVAASTA